MSSPFQAAESRPGPVILKPYGGARNGGPRRLRWWLVPALAFFCLVYGYFFALTAPYLIVPFAAPIALLGGLAIWALPDTDRAPVRLMTALLTAYIVCLFAWPGYLAIALPGLPWITPLRLTGFPMVIALLVSLSVSKAFRAAVAETLNTAPPLWKLLVAFVVLQFLTVPMSENLGQSLQRAIISQVNWSAVFLVSCYAFRTPGRVERYAALLWGLAVFVIFVGGLERAMGHVPWQGHVPSFLKVADADLYMGVNMRAAAGVQRIKSIFSTPLGHAEFLALCAPFVIHFAAGKNHPAIRLGALVTLPGLFYSIMTTDSRLGLVGLLVASLLYLLIWSVVRWRREKPSIIGATIVFAYPAVFCAALASTFLVGRIRNEIWGGGAQFASNMTRQAQIERGLPLIAKNPIGHGAGQGAETLGFGGFQTIDNYYLSIALEYGVLGFIAYYGMFLMAIWLAAKYALVAKHLPNREFSLLLPLAASLAAFVVIKAVFSQQDNHPMVFMMMGMVLALCLRIRSTSKRASAG